MNESIKNPSESIGELFLMAYGGLDPEPALTMIRDYGISGFYLSNDNVPDRKTAQDLSRILQEENKKNGQFLPLLLGVDQEGTWSVMAEDSNPGPGNLALGAADDPELTRKRYFHLGEELNACGMNLVFAPCSDVNTNPSNAIIGMRSFGTDPQKVGAQVVAAVEGLKESGTFSTLKHFPGHGDTFIDSHRALPTVSRNEKEVREIDLFPFAQGINAGVDLVMTSHICFEALDPNKPATFSSLILNNLLREELGFGGVVVSDSMNMHSLQKNYDSVDAAVEALCSGVDLIMLAEEHYDHDSQYQMRQRRLIEGVQKAFRDGKIPENRIVDAISRVRQLKGKIKNVENPRFEDSTWVSSSRESAAKAIRFLQKTDNWKRPEAKQRLNLLRAAPSSSYEIVLKTRGIGPNPQQSSFDSLKESLKNHFDVNVLDDFQNLDRVQDHLIVVFENYTLPGVDFGNNRDEEVIETIKNHFKSEFQKNITFVAMRDTFNLNLNHPFTTLCAYGFREESSQAIVNMLINPDLKMKEGDIFHSNH